jgi:hypothetical protein
MADTNKSKIKLLESSLERVAKKQKVAFTKTVSQLDFLIQELTKSKFQLDPGSIISIL